MCSMDRTFQPPQENFPHGDEGFDRLANLGFMRRNVASCLVAEHWTRSLPQSCYRSSWQFDSSTTRRRLMTMFTEAS